MANAISYVGPTLLTHQVENSIAYTGQHLWSVAYSHVVCVLTHSDITHIMHPVLDGPMLPPQTLQLRSVSLLPLQGGDTIMDCTPGTGSSPLLVKRVGRRGCIAGERPYTDDPACICVILPVGTCYEGSWAADLSDLPLGFTKSDDEPVIGVQSKHLQTMD